MVDVTAKPLTRRIATARCSVVTEADAGEVLRDRLGRPRRRRGGPGGRGPGGEADSGVDPAVPPDPLDRVSREGRGRGAPHRHQRHDGDRRAHRGRDGGPHGLRRHGPGTARPSSAVDPGASVEDLTLWHKSGGRSGVWERQRICSTGWKAPSPRFAFARIISTSLQDFLNFPCISSQMRTSLCYLFVMSRMTNIHRGRSEGRPPVDRGRFGSLGPGRGRRPAGPARARPGPPPDRDR